MIETLGLLVWHFFEFVGVPFMILGTHSPSAPTQSRVLVVVERSEHLLGRDRLGGVDCEVPRLYKQNW